MTHAAQWMSVTAVLAATIGTGPRARAADDGPTVTVVGTARQTVEPNMVRVRCRVLATGNTARSAITKLERSREALGKRIAGMSGPKPVVAFADPIELGAKEGTTAMQIRIMNAAMGGNPQDDEDEKKLVRMAFTATLEWPLSGKTPVERHGEADEIRQQLRDIQILDAGKSKKDDADDDDEAEESSGARGADEGESTIKIEDGPTFFFVRRLTDAEVAAATKAAFDDARAKSERLARAAGMTLGAVVSISDGLDSAHGVASQMRESIVFAQSMFGGTRPDFEEDAMRPPTELVGDRLKPILHRVDVTVVFRLK